MQPIEGRSLRNILRNRQTSAEKKARESIILGRERDDYGRPDNQGYPMRAIIREDMLLVLNLTPDRWPAGDPLTGYLDVDGSPTKTLLLEMQRRGGGAPYWEQSFGKRPAEELYDLSKDMDCVNNLADNPQYSATKEALKTELLARLTEQNDPRMSGGGDVFDSYPFDNPDKENFYERIKSGEITEPWKKTPWVEPTDYDLYFERQNKTE
jgi:hypothetical protein